MTTHGVIGRPTPQTDGVGKVRGATVYSADIQMDGMLWGKVLRSPYPHARILRIDTSRARAIPGVLAVVTAEDIPDALVGQVIPDMPMLARDKVRYAGEAVAVVAAEEADVAEEALAAIDVEYEELPAVFDEIEACQEGAPLVHDDPGGYQVPPRPGAGTPQLFRYAGTLLPLEDRPNVHAHLYWGKGDVDAGFAQADSVYEHTFTTKRVHQLYMEPHACVVWIDSDGLVQVRASQKSPFSLRRQLATAAALDPEQIVVQPVPIGGDFGGKASIMNVALAYFLAERTGRPVKIVMSYSEEFTAANPRHPATVTLRTGVTKDGVMTATHAFVHLNSGAYVARTTQRGLPLVSDAAGIYRTPNVRIDCLAVYTNSVSNGHYRGVGQPQMVFAYESHMDLIARDLGIDALEFRLKNVARDGDTSPVNEEWQNVRAAETLQKAADAIGWTAPKPAPNVGRGLSISEHHAIGGRTNVSVRVLADGAVAIRLPVPDQGGGLYLTLRQLVGEALGVPIDRITVETANTASAAPDSGVMGGSRATHVVGHIALDAVRQLKERLTVIAAERLGCAEDAVQVDGATFQHGGKQLSLAEIAAEADPDAVVGYQDQFIEEPMVTDFCAQGAEVAVDPETGELTILRIVSAHDVGTIINPLTHQGQIAGGVVQALGFALTEEMIVEDGRVVTTTLADYKIPNIKDIPPLETVLLDAQGGTGPYGAKSIGEHPLSNIAPAIANAIHDAVGVRITDLPLTSEKVYRALQAKAASS